MTIRNYLIVLIVCLLSGLSACQDHLNPSTTPGSQNARLRLKTVTQELGNNIDKVSQFKYDAQGRLHSIHTYQSPDSTMASLEYITYQYNEQNRLTQAQHWTVNYPRGSGGQSEQYTYGYNDAGRVSGIGHNYGHQWSYSYNDAGQLVSSSYYYAFVPRFTIRGGAEYTFAGNNLTQTAGGSTVRYQGMPDGVGTSFTVRPIATYTHDDKVNPFYGLFASPSPFVGFFGIPGGPDVSPNGLFGGKGNVLTLSKNNVLSEIPAPDLNGPTVTYQYGYNAANLPTVRIKTTTPAPGGQTSVTVETLRFEYESY